MAATALTPPLLAALGDLDLAARRVVEGMRAGLHRSPFHGYSAEFSQYRHYRPGDDLRYVDWKLLARTDRLYTRQYRETTDLAAALLIDTSASMGFDAGGVSKLAVAGLAAAALAWLLARQGDAVGLATAPASSPPLPPRTGQPHLRQVLAALARLRADGRSDMPSAIRRAADALPRRGLLLLFGDWYDDEEATLGELHRARHMGHDVAVFQVLTRAEIDFPYGDATEFRDPETGASLLTHAGAVRAAYRDNVAAFLERWRTRLLSEGIDATRILTDAPLDEALRTFLLRRGAGR